jgi:hypothetical protein
VNDCTHPKLAIDPTRAAPGAQCDGEILAKCLVCGDEFGVVPTNRGPWMIESPDDTTARRVTVEDKIKMLERVLDEMCK